MQSFSTYHPQNSNTAQFQEILLQLLSENEQLTNKYKKILHYISSCTTFNLQHLQFLLNSNIVPCNASVQKNNCALVDMQNVYQGVCEAGWKIDWKLFRQLLSDEYDVEKAVVFVGYLKENKHLYRFLVKAGFELQFREVEKLSNGYIDGGNCDADLAAYALNFKNDYDKAVVIADDGDYAQMLKMLKEQNKLKCVLSPHTIERTSKFIKNAIGIDAIFSIQSIREIIKYKR